jgi:hypothetical protein
LKSHLAIAWGRKTEIPRFARNDKKYRDVSILQLKWGSGKMKKLAMFGAYDR